MPSLLCLLFAVLVVAQSTNLLTNGGFETSKFTYRPWTSRNYTKLGLTVILPGYKSKNALRITNITNAHIFQRFQVPEAGIHYVTFNYRYDTSFSSGPQLAGLDVKLFRTEAYTQTDKPNGTWATFRSYAFLRPKAASIELTYNVGTARPPAWVDNFSVVKYQPQVDPAAVEVINNGNFETGQVSVPNSDFYVDGFRASSPGLNGTKFAARSTKPNPLFQITYDLQPGSHYRFGFDYSIPVNQRGRGAPLGVQFLYDSAVAGGLLASSVKTQQDIAAGNGTYEVFFVAENPVTLSYVYFNFTPPAEQTVKTFLVDNVSIKKLVTPP